MDSHRTEYHQIHTLQYTCNVPARIPHSPQDWSVKMKGGEARLTNSQKIIHEVSAGSRYGRTRDEIVNLCKKLGGPGETTVDHELPKMVKLDILRIVSPKGAKPFLYKPREECPLESDFKETCKLTEAADSIVDEDLEMMVRLASQRARDIIDHIDRNESWRKIRKIKTICRQEISPFIGTILVLKGAGVPVPAPWDYAPFWGKRPRAFWTGLTGPKELSGPIRLCRDAEASSGPRKRMVTIDSTGKRIVHPNLLEWRAYLRKVVTVLDSHSTSQHEKNKPSTSKSMYIQSQGRRYDRFVELPVKERVRE